MFTTRTSTVDRVFSIVYGVDDDNAIRVGTAEDGGTRPKYGTECVRERALIS